MKPLNETEIARLAALDIFDKIDQGDRYQYGKEPQLQAITQGAFQKVQLMNDVAKTDMGEATRLLHEFLPGMAASASITFPVNTIEYPEQLVLGEDSFINANLQIVSAGKVTIGKHAFIGPNAQFFTPNHHPYNVAYVAKGGSMIPQLQLGMMCGLVGR